MQDAATAAADAVARALAGDLSPIETGDLAPPDLADFALAQGVGPLLWDALSRAGGRGADVRRLLDADARAAATRELLVRAEVQRVLGAIASGGSRAVVFKGTALAYSAYGQPWHRPRTDTDLLVPVDEAPAVSAVLESCGYARSDALTSGTLVSHQLAFERTDAVGLRHVIDLHWKVLNPQIVADVLSFDEIWAGARTAPGLGALARVPSAVASAILACVHRLAHHQGQDRLVWLYDLRLLASQFDAEDWRVLCERAAARRVSAICLDGFERAHRDLGAPLPPEIASRLRTAGAMDPSRQYVEAAVHKRDVLVTDLSILPTWGARLRLLKEHAFPPAAFIRQRYGVRSSWWLPVLYCHRLVTGAFRWARQ